MLYVAVEPCLLKRGAAGQLEAAGWDEKGSEQTEISRKEWTSDKKNEYGSRNLGIEHRRMLISRSDSIDSKLKHGKHGTCA